MFFKLVKTFLKFSEKINNFILNYLKNFENF